jgi:hypothetical protein
LYSVQVEKIVLVDVVLRVTIFVKASAIETIAVVLVRVIVSVGGSDISYAMSEYQTCLPSPVDLRLL